MRKAVNIEWDMDEEDMDFLAPTEWNIPNKVRDEDVADYLSDTFGFFVTSYVLEVA